MCIIRFADEQGIIQNGRVSIPRTPIQQDIANMAGTSREPVSRALSILEKEDLIARKGRELMILDYKNFIQEFDASMLQSLDHGVRDNVHGSIS